MADTIQFDLVSPEKLVASEAVEMVVVPGGEGDLGILPGHSLLIGTVRPGVIAVHQGGKVKDRIFVAGGFVEVNPETCTVLAEDAVPVADLDKAQATERLGAAKKALAEAADDRAKGQAEAEIAVAEAMVEASKT
ncbi:MAG: F0F1 ATP synthase subunit epsilon [Rhodospirillaceae bacterium]